MWNLIHYRRLGTPRRHSGEFRRSTRQEADRRSNGRESSDLFWALKGGSINFGIVCRFDLERKDALLEPMEDLAGEARGAGGVTDVGQDTPRLAFLKSQRSLFEANSDSLLLSTATSVVKIESGDGPRV
jgi:hypothetical protein